MFMRLRGGQFLIRICGPPKRAIPPRCHGSTTWLSSLSTSKDDSSSSSASWDDSARQFLKVSLSNETSADAFRHAKAVMNELMPSIEYDEDETFEPKKVFDPATRNATLAFQLLDRILQLEQDAILNTDFISNTDVDNQSLNIILQIWRENVSDSSNMTSSQVLQKLDAYRSVSSSILIPDIETYNILLDGAAIRGEVQFCESLYNWLWEESKQHSLLRPDVITLRTMFKAWINQNRHLYQNSERTDSMNEAPQACEALVQQWSERNHSTKGIYKSLVHAWAHYDPLQSEIYLKTMVQRHLENEEEEGPDTVAWNRVISAYAIIHDQPIKAAKLLEEFWDYANHLDGKGTNVSDVRPNLLSYNSVLEGWAKLCNAKEANKIFTRLRTASSTSPNIISYTSAIKANGSNWKKVQEYADECIEAYTKQQQREETEEIHLILDHPFFHTWMQAALKAGRGSVAVGRVQDILKQMKHLGVVPDTKSHLTLLECFLKNNDDIEGATKWFMENAKSMEETSIVAWVTKLLNMVDDISIVPPLIYFGKRKSMSFLQSICEQKLIVQPENMEKLLSQLNGNQGWSMLQWIERAPTSKECLIVLHNLMKEHNTSDAEALFLRWQDHYLDSNDEDISLVLADMYTSLILVWSKSGSVERCLFWLQEWIDSNILNVPPTQRVYTAILSAFANAGDAEGAKHFLRQLLDGEESHLETAKPDIVMFNIVLNALAKSGSVDRAQDFFENEMPERDTFTYNIMINALVRNGNVGLAREYIQKMIDVDQRMPDLATFRPLLISLSRSKDANAAARTEELLLWMKELNHEGILSEPPDSHCFQLVLEAWAKSKLPEAAQRAEDILRNEIPNVTASSYSTVMRAYKNNPGQKQALLHEMYGTYLQGNKQMKPTHESFHLVLEDLVRTSPKQAESFLRQMKQMYNQGLNTAKPTRKSFNVVMKAWSKSKNPKAGKKCEVLLREMQSMYLEEGDSALKPSVDSYKVVLSAYSKEKNIAKLESIFDELFGAYCATSKNKQSLQPDAVCANSLLHAYRATNNVVRAQGFLSQVEEWKDEGVLDMKLNVSSYNLILACMASKGMAEESEALLEHMEHRGIKPNVISYNTAMNAWARTRLPEAVPRVESLFKKMKENPDHMTFSIWLRAIVKSSGISDKKRQSEKVLKEMKNKGFQPNERDLKLYSVARANKE